MRRSDRRRIARMADLAVGSSASVSKTITEADLTLFVGITGDANPLHTDDEFATGTFFGGRIAHGMLTASLLSAAVGMELPGTGAIYRSQSLRFLAPVRIGDTVTARLEIVDLDPEGNLVTMAATIDNQDGRTVIDGEAVVSLLRATNPDLPDDVGKETP